MFHTLAVVSQWLSASRLINKSDKKEVAKQHKRFSRRFVFIDPLPVVCNLKQDLLKIIKLLYCLFILNKLDET